MTGAAEVELRWAREQASEKLAQIATLFKPHMKATLLIRSPAFPDGTRDFMLTNDTIPDAIASLELLAKRPVTPYADWNGKHDG